MKRSSFIPCENFVPLGTYEASVPPRNTHRESIPTVTSSSDAAPTLYIRAFGYTFSKSLFFHNAVPSIAKGNVVCCF